MIPLNLTFDGSHGVTLLSNAFIDQYMTDANDSQIKVYLYLLRMVSANLPTNISEIADKFNDTEKDVIRCLKYWEKLQLLHLDYDSSEHITGIHFTDLNADRTVQTRKEETAAAAPAADTGITAPVLAVTPAAPSNKIPRRKITMMTMDYEKAKEAYSLQDIKNISSDPNVKMLLIVAERYFERPLGPDEIKSILFIYDRLAFSFELIDYLLQYCIDQGQKSIRYMEQIAFGWYEAGVTTEKQAKAATHKQENNTYAIMSYLGKSAAPADKELAFIRKWTGSYGFNLAIIEDACGRAVLATDQHRFEYADSILKNWHDANVRTKEDIAKLDKAYEEGKKARAAAKQTAAAYGASSRASKSTSSFTNIESHDYDFDAIEKALLKISN